MSFHMKTPADGIVCTTAESVSDNDADKEKKETITTTADIGSKPHTSASRFVRELRPEEIRWFYKKTAQDKTWQPLDGRDSLSIENEYRRRASQEKPATATEESNAEDVKTPVSTADGTISHEKSVVVFGGLYCLVYDAAETPESPSKPSTTAVSDEKSKAKLKYYLKPIYWEGSSLLLTRGTWFFEASGGEWQPLDADSAEFVQKIESKHLNVFSNQRIPEKPVYFEKGPRPVLCEVADAEEEKYAGYGARARWHSVVDVLLVNNSRSSRLWRYLNLTGAGTKLMRGYHTEARMEDGPEPVNHLLFVIHGIGQKRQRNKIVTNATSLREISDQLIRSHDFMNDGGRPMFLPVDWRNELQLDEELIASITPCYLEQIRSFFNETLMDLLYYASPIFGPQVISGMSSVLNRLYRLYLSNDPDFEARGGKVSLIAHSLGSVITYDILTGGWYGQSAMQPTRDDRISIMPGANSESSPLIFPVAHLFCFGSPLGVFLAARHRRGLRIIQRHEDDESPETITSNLPFRLHNIYHPADPVAYRIEPLISQIYSGVKPLRVHRYNSTEHSPYECIRPAGFSTRGRGRPAKGENGSNVKTSESEENASGFESDEGPTMVVQKQLKKVQASSPSPPPKRSWSAAVFSRLGMGKSDKESSTPPRAASPVVADVVDEDKEKSSGGPSETLVLTKAVEAAAEVVEAVSTAQEKANGVKDGEQPLDLSKNKEKEKMDEFEIPPAQAIPYRVDYTLRQGRMEYAYWAAIVSHISYWANHDAVMYILSALYGPPKLPNK